MNNQTETSRYDTTSAYDNNMGGRGNFMYLVAGGVIGAAAALLFAPKPGAALRSDIADVTRKGYDGALDLSSRVKDQTSNLYQSIREKGSELTGEAKQAVDSGTKAIEDTAQETRDTANNVLSIGDKEQSDSGDRGFNASNIV